MNHAAGPKPSTMLVGLMMLVGGATAANVKIKTCWYNYTGDFFATSGPSSLSCSSSHKPASGSSEIAAACTAHAATVATPVNLVDSCSSTYCYTYELAESTAKLCSQWTDSPCRGTSTGLLGTYDCSSVTF